MFWCLGVIVLVLYTPGWSVFGLDYCIVHGVGIELFQGWALI